MELDLLEKNILKAIDQSSVFHISEIKNIYEQCKSFDKTILVLKKAASCHISTNDAILQLGIIK